MNTNVCVLMLLAVPKVCALPSRVKNFPKEKLGTRWHIVYTQPDFVENIFSHNCLCNTVTMQPSEQIKTRDGSPYPGSWQAAVVCRASTPTGKRSDFVRPVYEISNLTSYLAHFTQKLYQGIANEHWQILDHTDDYEHMLLYTVLQ